MGLDLARVATQVGSMVARLKAGNTEHREHLSKARDTLANPPIGLDQLREKVAASKTTWLVARLVDGLNGHFPARSTPPEFNIIATDGSHIDIDRHRAARCYMINIGAVTLRYGARPEAHLESLPNLYFNDEDLVIPSPTFKERDQPVEGALLGIKRSVAECQQLARLAAGPSPGTPTLALLDGSLILWGLEAYPDFVAQALLDKALLKYLDEILDRKVPLASYISYPRSTDVVNVLRVALCPREIPDCDRHCSEKKSRECDAVAGVQDRELFFNLLDKGERSALFISPSRIVERHYGKHQVFFFYLRNEDEIARVEIPAWVALNDNWLNLVHTLVLDQCRRGQGYPVALSEAHEKAVVTGADRELFWQLVESSLVDEHLPVSGSAKSLSKRTRWV